MANLKLRKKLFSTWPTRTILWTRRNCYSLYTKSLMTSGNSRLKVLTILKVEGIDAQITNSCYFKRSYGFYLFICFYTRLTVRLCILMCYSKQTSIEIEQLNARVVEAETKLKTEVTRIKKKLHIQITELEMSLDVANKNNIELQKTIKKQSLHLTVKRHFSFQSGSFLMITCKFCWETRKTGI